MDRTNHFGRIKAGLAAAALAAALTATAQAEERVYWISIGDGITSTATLNNAVQFAKDNKFNAVCVLARYRADALYIPNRNYSSYANPEPRRTNSIDTLQHVIDRAKEQGLRVYAATSCFIVSDGTSAPYPSHVNSSWVQHVYQGSSTVYAPNSGFPRAMQSTDTDFEGFWIDPGIPAARSYVTNVICDIVQNYDVDGIVLDRVRYPGDAFPKGNASFGYNPAALSAMGISNPYPNATSWTTARRNAVTTFVKDTQAAIHAVKPWVIYSATPIIYSDNTTSTYDYVFQHIPSWSSTAVSTSIHGTGFGVLDAVMPQYYRDTPSQNLNAMGLVAGGINTARMKHLPLFQSYSAGTTGAKLAENICDARGGSILGQGFGVFSSTSLRANSGQFVIDTNAASTSCGTNIIGTDSPLTDFTNKTGWDSTPPGTPGSLVADNSEAGKIVLTWTAASDATKYLIYRSTSAATNAYWTNLQNKTTTVSGTTYEDTAVAPSTNYYYRVVAVDGYNNKTSSTVVGPVAAEIPVLYLQARNQTSGALNSGYSEPTGTFSNTASVSCATGLGVTCGASGYQGSRFSQTVGHQGRFTKTVATAGYYDVYVTIHGNTTPNANSNANANANWTATGSASSTESGSVQLIPTDVALADTWKKLTTTALPVAAGDPITVTFTNQGGGISPTNRFNMDAVRFLWTAPYAPPDTTAPTVSSIVAAQSSPTNSDSLSWTVTFSEDVTGFSAANDVVVGGTGTTNSGATITPVSDSVYTVTLNGVTGNGTVTVAVSTANGVQDTATNALATSPTSAAVTVDQLAPTGTAVAAATKVAGNINVSTTLSGTGSSISAATLLVRQDGGDWESAGSIAGGTLAFTPAGGSGVYDFAVAITDAAGNSKSPSTAEATTIYSSTLNGPLSFTVAAGQTRTFPMTDSLNVQIGFGAGVTPGGPVSVTRVVGNNNPVGYNASQLIDEYLTLSGAFSGGTATIVWNYNPASAGSLVGDLNTVYRSNGGVTLPVASGQVAFGTNMVTVTGVTAFSDWYIGDNNASMPDWSAYE